MMLIQEKEIYPQSYGKAQTAIDRELWKAIEKHPYWPVDILHGLAVIQEELGEAFQEGLDITYFNNGNTDNLKKELAQTGAMCIRMLAHIENKT